MGGENDYMLKTVKGLRENREGLAEFVAVVAKNYPKQYYSRVPVRNGTQYGEENLSAGPTNGSPAHAHSPVPLGSRLTLSGTALLLLDIRHIVHNIGSTYR